jgi:hypothetical protein
VDLYLQGQAVNICALLLIFSAAQLNKHMANIETTPSQLRDHTYALSSHAFPPQGMLDQA